MLHRKSVGSSSPAYTSSVYLSADIIQFSFIICNLEFTNHDHLMHANAAVLLHFVYDTDTFSCYASYTKNFHPVFPHLSHLPCLLILSEMEPIAQNLSTYLQTALLCKTGTSGSLFEFVTHLMTAEFIIYIIQKCMKQL